MVIFHIETILKWNLIIRKYITLQIYIVKILQSIKNYSLFRI